MAQFVVAAAAYGSYKFLEWLAGDKKEDNSPCPFCNTLHECTRNRHGCPHHDHYDRRKCPNQPPKPRCPFCNMVHRCRVGHFACDSPHHYTEDGCFRKGNQYNRTRKSEFINPSGGKIELDGAKVKIPSGAIRHRTKVQAEVEHAPKNNPIAKRDGDEFLVDSSLSLTVDSDHSGGAQGDERSAEPELVEGGTIEIYTECPPDLDPVVLRSNTVNRHEPTNFTDDTENAAPKVNRRNGSIKFRMKGAIKVIFQIIWPLKKESPTIIENILAYMRNDDVPFYVHLHYCCERPLGHPCEVMLLIGTGEPPTPEPGSREIKDGIYTAGCTKGEFNCQHIRVSQKSNVRVEIMPEQEDSEEIFRSPLVYTYNHRKQKNMLQRNFQCKHPCISVFRKLFGAKQSSYTFELSIKDNGLYVGYGTSRLEIYKQVPQVTEIRDIGQDIVLLSDIPSDARLLHISQLLSKLKAGPRPLFDALGIQENSDKLCLPNQGLARAVQIKQHLRAWSNKDPEHHNRRVLFETFCQRIGNDKLLQAVVDIFREPTCLPSSPGVNVIKQHRTSVDVRVIPSKDFGGYPKVTYKLFLDQLNVSRYQPFAELQVEDVDGVQTFINLLPQRLYRVHAQATNGAGSTQSTMAMVNTCQLAPPSAPAVILVSRSTTSASVQVIPSAENGGHPLVAYTLSWRLLSVTKVQSYSSFQVTDVDQVQQIPSLLSNQTYEVFAQASNDSGTTNSDVVTVTTSPADVPPEALTELASHISSKEECIRLASKLGFEHQYIIKWENSSDTTEAIAQDILLLWVARTTQTSKGTQTVLAGALIEMDRRDLCITFLKKCDELTRKM